MRAYVVGSEMTHCLLPQDVLASVLLRLPASDLRRCRRVCREWRDVMSDHTFIREHMLHGPRAPTHTIVFLPSSSRHPRGAGADCGGFLFDEHWRLAARFAAGESEDMMGTCKGLLCFLDAHQRTISVVEPFTGESLALPLPPPETPRRLVRGAYCFGFDPKGRRFKIVHHPEPEASETETGGAAGGAGQEVYVCTVGGGNGGWRSVHAGGAAAHGDPVCVDGVVYWSVLVGPHRLGKLARLDLATEEVTYYPDSFVAAPRTPVYGVVIESDARVCLMTVGLRGELDALFLGEDGRWVHDDGHTMTPVTVPTRRHLSWPQALQRGHLLLEDEGGRGLYAHPISRGLGHGKLLEMCNEEAPAESSPDGQCDGRRTPISGFFPVRTVEGPWAKQPAAVERAPFERGYPRTFGYVPTVSPAPLAHYLSMSCIKFRQEQNLTV